jgi:hypothetical protein
MGQSWSSRAADYPTYERRRRKAATKSERTKGSAQVNSEYKQPYSTNSTVRRRDGQAVSRSVTPKTHQGDHRQTPSRTSRHTILSATARITKEEPSIPDRRQNRKDAQKKPESGRIKREKNEENDTKHKVISRKDSHHNHLHERHRGKREEKKECVVCTDKISLHHFPDRPPTKDCKHGVDVCRKCLRTWMESEFSTKMWDDIKCPTCSTAMKRPDMQAFAPKEVFKRY